MLLILAALDSSDKTVKDPVAGKDQFLVCFLKETPASKYMTMSCSWQHRILCAGNRGCEGMVVSAALYLGWRGVLGAQVELVFGDDKRNSFAQRA